MQLVQMEKIAVLGLGKMGHAIASRLITRGFNVLVWNRTRGRETGLLSMGAQWAESPAAAAAEASVMISMVADDEASRAVWLGEKAALPKMKAGSFLIECSTLSFDYVSFISGEAQKQGLIYLDCPVTGLPAAAAEGKLTLLLGGDAAHIETVKPILAAFSDTIRHFGNIGSGTAYKLMINLMGAVQIAALAEGLALADQLGLDKEKVIDAIQHSAAASPQVIRNARQMADRNFGDQPVFTVGLRYKDAAYAIALAKSANSRTPLGETALNWFAAAKKTGAAADESAIIREINARPLKYPDSPPF